MQIFSEFFQIYIHSTFKINGPYMYESIQTIQWTLYKYGKRKIQGGRNFSYLNNKDTNPRISKINFLKLFLSS